MRDNKFRFTKQSIDTRCVCPAGKTEAIFYDDMAGGFAIRVTAAGVKTFVVIKKLAGKTHRITLGQYDRLTSKIEAIRNKASVISGQMAKEVEEKVTQKKASAITLRLAFETMLENKEKLSEGSIADYRKSFDNHLIDFEQLPLIEFDHDLVKKIFRDITNQKNKQNKPKLRTANKALRILSITFNFAMAWYAKGRQCPITYNPVDILKVTKQWHANERDKTRVQPDDLGEFITACFDIESEGPQRRRPSVLSQCSSNILFMTFSGMRPAESASIKKSMVDHEYKAIRFENDEGTIVLKNGKRFHLVLNDVAYAQILYAISKSDNDYVFPSINGGPLHESCTRDFLKKVEKRMHESYKRKTLRASFISVADYIGISGYHQKVLVNHSGKGQDVDVTDGYKTVTVTEILESSMKVEAKLIELSGMTKEHLCRGLLDQIERKNILTFKKADLKLIQAS